MVSSISAYLAIFYRHCIECAMNLFCLLWIPVFYFFRRTITPSSVPGSGYLWALLPGCAVVLVQYFVGPLVRAGGFGLSRWATGFIDIVSLPVLLPLAACFLLVALKALPAGVGTTEFILLWLIPLAAFRSVTWNSQRTPMMLVVVPLLWTALAVGIPFFIHFIVNRSRWYIMVPSVLGAIALPLAAATSWWAFFSQRGRLGFLLLVASLVPAAVTLTLRFIGKLSRYGARGELVQ